MPAYLLLLSALRNLWRNKLHSLINLASLTLGLAVFAFAFLYVKHEESFDRGWPNADRIHRVVLTLHGLPGANDGEFSEMVGRAYDPLVMNFADVIDKASRFATSPVRIEGDTSNNYAALTFVDPDFGSIFQPEVTSGSYQSAFQRPGFVAVEEKFAANYPGGKLTVGRRILLEGSGYTGPGFVAGKVEYEVGAIFKLPPNTSNALLQLNMITLMSDYSLQLFPSQIRAQIWSNSIRIWALLKPHANLDSVQARMPELVDRAVTAYNSQLKAGDHISAHLNYRFQPLTDLHFHPVGIEALSTHGDQNQVLTFAAIGILVLLVGCSNSVSLSLAAVLERRRDIGVHKAVGALRGDILAQYLGESVLLSLLALIPAIALVEWLLPVLRTLLRMPQQLEPSRQDFVVLCIIALAAGLASGAYPALVLAGVKPQQVLKTGGNRNAPGNNRIRMLLVSFQYCFAVMLMIATLALFLQLQVVRNQPLGFNPHNLVYMSPSNDLRSMGMAAFQQELQKIDGVTALSSLSNPPNLNLPATVNTNKFVNKGAEEIEVGIHTESVGAETIQILGIPLLAGRLFDESRDALDIATGLLAGQQPGEKPENRIILNRTAIRALGFVSPEAAVEQVIYSHYTDRTGKTYENPFRIIGVIEDNMYGSLRRKPTPEGFSLLRMQPGAGFVPGFLLKFEEGKIDTLQQQLDRNMLTLSGSRQVYPQFVETRLAAEFDVERNQGKLLLYCATLALFLSCIGLFGLASFTMQRNMKEVGVRKVMGASVLSLTGLYLWRYAKPVLVATVLASPIAVYFVLQWLQRFPYQLEKWWLFPLCLAAGGTVLLIALLTVAGIVIRTARTQPVKSLRYE